MARPKRDAQQVDLQATIKETAWKQIAESGAATLSLRAIARELGITAPAIYNYFQRRDDLVTALIIDAYTSFGDSQLAARDGIPADDLPGQFWAIGVAYRDWALTYPQRYLLIFGTPIPGYEAPFEKVLPSSARSLSALAETVEALRLADKLHAKNFPEVQEEYRPYLEVWRKHVSNVDLLSLAVAMLIWSRVHGLVSLEITHAMPPFGPNGDALYRYELSLIAKEFVIP